MQPRLALVQKIGAAEWDKPGVACGVKRLFGQTKELSEVFTLVRSEACILGTLAAPLAGVGRNYLLRCRDMLLRPSMGGAVQAVAYLEQAPNGVIDSIELCDAANCGFLKLCRTENTCVQKWRNLIFSGGIANLNQAEALRIRKTNHLDFCAMPSDATARQQELRCREELMAICREAIDAGWGMRCYLRDARVRARLLLVPTVVREHDLWIFLGAANSGIHVLPCMVTGLLVTESSERVEVRLFGRQREFFLKLVIQKGNKP